MSVQVKGLFVDYGKFRAVEGVSFGVPDESLVALLGPSGCGKTTTLRAIAGLESVTGGEISIDEGVVSSAERSVPPEKRGVNMVFQSYAVWPHMSVVENVLYGLRAQRVNKQSATRRADEAMEMVGIENLANRYPTELSGGQQQRVALARAVVTEPRVLLFDEPLSNLDAGLRVRMRREIVRVHKLTGMSAVYVTHDQEEAMAIADHVVLMNEGRIVQQGEPREIYNRPTTVFAASFVGAANVWSGYVASAGEKNGALDSTESIVRFVDDPDLWLFHEYQARHGDVSVIVRPERVNVERRNGPGNNPDSVNGHWTGVVREAEFLGPRIKCRVEVSPMFSVRAEVESKVELRVGDEVDLHVAAEDVTIVPWEATQTSSVDGEEEKRTNENVALTTSS